MRIGCAGWMLGKDRFTDAVQAARDAGLNAVSFTWSPQESLSINEQDELFELMENHDIVTTFHTAVGMKGDTEWQKVLKRRLALIREWHEQTGRLTCVTFDPGNIDNNEPWRLDLAGSSNTVRSAVEVFVPLGVRVAIENGFSFLHTISELKEFAEAIKPMQADMLLDLGHLNMCFQKYGWDPGEFIRECPMEIIEIHIHDNDGDTDQHMPLGQGNLDLKPIVAALKARGFDGVATLENRCFNTASEASDIWRKCAAIFRKTWGFE